MEFRWWPDLTFVWNYSAIVLIPFEFATQSESYMTVDNNVHCIHVCVNRYVRISERHLICVVIASNNQKQT